jgi:TetR/AcrR family transcriptional regulator
MESSPGTDNQFVSNAIEVGTEQQIFNAALEVFSRKGRDGARMQEIANCAGINRALLHYYFRSKSKLYEAVFAHGFKQFIGGLSQSLRSERSFESSLRTFVHGYMDYLCEHQDMARLMITECLSGGPILESYLTTVIAKRKELPSFLMEDRIQQAIEVGEIREVDSEHAMLTIVSACLFPFIALPTVRLFLPQAATDFEEFIEERKQHIVELILSGLRVL